MNTIPRFVSELRAALQRNEMRMNELSSTTGSAYEIDNQIEDLRDEIRSMQDQIDDLEEEIAALYLRRSLVEAAPDSEQEEREAEMDALRDEQRRIRQYLKDAGYPEPEKPAGIFVRGGAS